MFKYFVIAAALTLGACQTQQEKYAAAVNPDLSVNEAKCNELGGVRRMISVGSVNARFWACRDPLE